MQVVPSELVAGSLGAGDGLADQLQGQGRAEGHQVPEQAGTQQDVVAAEQPDLASRIFGVLGGSIPIADVYSDTHIQAALTQR